MQAIEWIKKNWLPLLAIILSMASFFRCESFVFTESSLNWVLGIVVAIVGIAVSVALVTQIWTAIQIDKMMDEKIKKVKSEIDDNLKKIDSKLDALKIELESKSLNQATSVSMYVMGQIKALAKDYDNALFCLLFAIKSAKAAGLYGFCEMYSEQTLSFFDSMMKNGIQIYMSSKEKDLQIKDISGVPGGEKTETLIRFIASLPEPMAKT